MYLCYLDESGVAEIPGNSTHFVLAGIAIPIERWREADAAVSAIMDRYGLAGEELHTAWLLRKYLEQSRVDGFEAMDWNQRKAQVGRLRVAEIHRVRKLGIARRNRELKKLYRHTEPYTHLSLQERQKLASEVVETVASWEWARLFASCINKGHFLTLQRPDGAYQVDTEAFSRILYVFAHFLRETESPDAFFNMDGRAHSEFGLLIHDNNPTVAVKHTRVMQKLREPGTHLQEFLEQIIETPLFVDSRLTRMVQLADLWAYAIRRYLENGEETLFVPLLRRSRTRGYGIRYPVVRAGVHHFTEESCPCLICTDHLSRQP